MRSSYWLYLTIIVFLLGCQKQAEVKGVSDVSAMESSLFDEAGEPLKEKTTETNDKQTNVVSSQNVENSTIEGVTLIESWPKETTLDNEHIQDAFPVWLEAIEGAQETLDFSEYYATTAPNSSMEAIFQALQGASERGVKIRFLLDKTMLNGDNLPLAERLGEIPNLSMRTIDYKTLMGGGVQHSKYFIVDGKYVIFGSQNFDWRSLEHIAEMGARVGVPELVAPFKSSFEMDWHFAEQTAKTEWEQAHFAMPVVVNYGGESHWFEVGMSPKGFLPDENLWDLPKIIRQIDEAKHHIYVQLLDYCTTTYDHQSFFELDEALQRAASRGVEVRLLVSDWSKRKKLIGDLKRLEQIPNISTKMMVIPEASTGFVPYSRVIHSKFMVVDEDQTWLGTSNWSGDYFYKSRNVGLHVKGKAINSDLTRAFLHQWDSEYAEQTNPSHEYEERKRY